MRIPLPPTAGGILAGGAALWSDIPVHAGPGPDALRGLSLRDIARRKLHHGRGRFRNPWGPRETRRFGQALRWKLLSRNRFKHRYRNERVRPVTVDWDAVRGHPGLSVTFITHSTVLIRDAGFTILVDPVLGGLFGPIKNFTPLAFDPGDLPRPDLVLITHGHYDHLDLPSVARFARSSRFASPLGHRKVLQSGGAAHVRELDWFDSLTIGSREIVLLPCRHWSMRNPIAGPNTALWGSFLVKTACGPVIYVSGDLAYFDRFEDIGREADIDLAIFNLGAYEPRWFMKHAHIDPAETVRAFTELGAQRIMAVHWGTFRLGDEPVYLPRLELREEMELAGLMEGLVDLEHGQTLFFDR